MNGVDWGRWAINPNGDQNNSIYLQRTCQKEEKERKQKQEEEDSSH